MYAEKVISCTDAVGRLKTLPQLPPNKQFEIIFLDCSVPAQEGLSKKRHPHPDIIGKTKILGDVFESAPASDWNLPK